MEDRLEDHWDIPSQQSVIGAQLQQFNPKQMTRRQRLEFRRAELIASLDAVDAALAALDANPNLEQFIETPAKVGV